MKNILLALSTFLASLFFTACASEIVIPIQSNDAISEIDTIIMFDAFTFLDFGLDLFQ